MSFLSNLFGGAARAAARDLERRLDILRAELRQARESGNAEALRRLLSRPAELGLHEDDAALEIETAEGLLEVGELRSSVEAGGPLPVVATSHKAVGSDICHFIAPVGLPDIPESGGGKLLLTNRRLVFIGTPQVSLGWAHVVEVQELGRDIVVRTRPGKVHVFRCNSCADTLKGIYLARRLALHDQAVA